MDRLLTQQLRIFYLKRRKKQNLYLYTQLSCSTKPNHFFILFISPFSLSFISKEIHHQRRFSLYFFFYYSFPKLNYRFRFAAGRASPSLIHFIFFFLHSVHQTINVCPDWCLFSSLAHASSSTYIYILQVDRKGADVDDIIFLLTTKSFALPFFCCCWRTSSAKFEICTTDKSEMLISFDIREMRTEKERRRNKTLRTYRAPSYYYAQRTF
jgi:hypothetical protein